MLPDPALTQGRSKILTVVIDAGHGGHDPGALGKTAREKTINLSVALKLGNLIQRNFKNVRVIYTRDRDKFVEVYRRAEIANEAKADLFISIHCNANENRSLKGAETYVMGLHRSSANLKIAKLENAAILLESDYQSSYDGFDPNSDESYILFNLYQNANLERSTAFAAEVQEQMVERVGMQNRGVRQAGFLVLYKTAMPSVLIETGYISNTTEEKFLASSQGQDFIASAIFRAFKSFVSDGKKESAGPSVETESDSALNEKPLIVAGVIKPEFRIQVATSATPLPKESKVYANFKSVKMYRHGGLFKYTVGVYTDPGKAEIMLDAVRAKGYPDAFIVVFRNNERIPQKEADSILRK